MEFVRNAELADRIAGLLPLVSDRLQRLSEGLSEQTGLSPVQLQLVEYIFRSGPTSIGTLRRALRRAQSSISELTDRLEERGLVQRVAGADRRQTLVRLTREGKDWMLSRQRRQRAALQCALSGVDPSTRDSLREALTQILSVTDELHQN